MWDALLFIENRSSVKLIFPVFIITICVNLCGQGCDEPHRQTRGAGNEFHYRIRTVCYAKTPAFRAVS